MLVLGSPYVAMELLELPTVLPSEEAELLETSRPTHTRRKRKIKSLARNRSNKSNHNAPSAARVKETYNLPYFLASMSVFTANGTISKPQKKCNTRAFFQAAKRRQSSTTAAMRKETSEES